MEIDLLHVSIGFAVLVVLYGLLVFEVMHRTAAALLSAAIILILNVILRFTDYTDLIRGIDLNTILLLMSMMMIVSVLSRTGVFGYLASKILLKFYLSPFLLIITLTTITAVVSAFIDNVTTVLLITPIVLEIMDKLRIDPRPVLMAIVFASNIGGTATLIGDPPNIIIGSAAGLGFNDFIFNLAPAVALDFLLFLVLIRIMYSRWIVHYKKRVGRLGEIKAGKTYIDRPMLYRVLGILFLVLVMFLLEDFFEYPPAIPPLIGVGLLMLLSRNIDIENVLRDVDWSTLVFFAAMFVVIRGVERLGVMDFIANGISSMTSDFTMLLLLIVWISAIVSAFVDNIPFVMSMIPVIAAISRTIGVDAIPLYWALSLGGCLGGNGTIVGASANVVVAGISDRHGYHISFKTFMRYGMPVLFLTVGFSSIYLVLRYAILHY